MECVPVTTVSQNGQVVIPERIRKEAHIIGGMKFAVFARNGTIILKRIDVPSAEEAFEEIHEWGIKHAKTKGLKEGDVVKKIHDGRGVKYGSDSA